MTYIGIDPGVSGGIAAISNGIALAWKMPETDRDIVDLLRAVAPVRGEARAMVEKVNPGVFARPGQERKMGVVSAFTFGGNYRALKMALTACDIPYDEVLPVKWQTALGCRSHGDKNITKARAQQLFPEYPRITHAVADALLLAEHCRRLHSGQAVTATPAQQGLFNGKEDEEGKELHIIIAGDEEIGEVVEEIIAGERAAYATHRHATGNGRPGHRGDRKGRARLR